jgi:hypothetical protein
LAALQLELIRRNARFRAWRAYGLPAAGHWRLAESGLVVGSLRCHACQEQVSYAYDPSQWGDAEGVDWQNLLAEGERTLVSKLSRYKGCWHLRPLLTADPPEVRAITELELLSGD